MPLDPTTLALGALVTVATVAVAAAVHSLRAGADPAVRRLRAAASTSGALTTSNLVTVPSAPADLASLRAPAPGVARSEDDSALRLRRKLVWAGYRQPRAPTVFVTTKGGLAFALLLGFLLVNGSRAEPLAMGPAFAAWLGGLGFFLPNLWLSSRVAQRLKLIDRALPDALDLLVTCVEAGLGLDAALKRVADEIALAWPLLSSELRVTSLEVKAGIPRMEALRRLADRTGSTELRSLSATLTQTEMFGTSVAAALRVQAEGIRIRRMQRAEELAAYLAVKMTMPLVLCILPSLFAIVIGPAAINIVEKLFVTFGTVK